MILEPDLLLDFYDYEFNLTTGLLIECSFLMRFVSGKVLILSMRHPHVSGFILDREEGISSYKLEE